MRSVIDEVQRLLEVKQSVDDKLAGQMLTIERLKGVVADLQRTSIGLEASILNLDPVVQHGGKTVTELMGALKDLKKMIESQTKIVSAVYIPRFEKYVEKSTTKKTGAKAA